MKKTVANPTRWSYGAIECYRIGCNCSQCDVVPDDLKTKCRMKLSVIKLVEKLGKPNETESEVEQWIEN